MFVGKTTNKVINEKYVFYIKIVFSIFLFKKHATIKKSCHCFKENSGFFYDDIINCFTNNYVLA